MKKYTIILLFLLTNFNGFGEFSPTLYLTTDDGLPQSHVYNMYKDSRGFLWLCTGGGLVRYDGNQLRTYGLGMGYPFSLVQKMIEVSPGVFWLSDFSKGIWELKGEDFRLVNFLEPGSLYPVTDIALLPNGDVVALTEGDGGFYILGKKGTKHFSTPEYSLKPDLKTVATGSDGEIYLGTQADGLLVFANNQIVEQYTTQAEVLPSNDVITVHPFSKDDVWVGTEGGIAILGNPELSKQFNQQFDYCMVRNVYREHAKSYWISMVHDKGGLVHFDGEHFTTFHWLKEAWKENNIYGVLIDGQKNMFIGSPYGLFTITDRNFLNYDTYDGLADPYIKGITQDADGVLWVGTKQSGLFYLDGNQFIPQPFTKKMNAEQQVITIKRVGDQIWSGTLGGLHIYQNHKFIVNEITDAFQGKYLRHISEKYEDSVGIACRRSLYLVVDNRVEDITYNLKTIVNSFWGLEWDVNGDLITSTNGNGLWRLEDKQWIEIDSGLKPLLGFNWLVGMSKAPDGSLLLPSKNGGFSWDGEKVTLIFNRGITIWEMLVDKEGDLWVGASDGIYQVHENEVSHYNRNMGLVTSEFNMKSFFMEPNGSLWFGGVGGLVNYRKKYPVKKSLGNRIHITMVDNGNRVFHFPSGKHTFFPYDQNNVTFRYATPHFHHPGKIVYRHKLEGYDDEFQTSTHENSVSYTNLSHGDYTFVVQSKLPNNAWSSVSDSFPFVIQTPWWKNHVAYFFYLLLLIGLIRAFLKWRLKVLEKRNVNLEQKVDSRMHELKKSNLKLEAEVQERMAIEIALQKEKESMAVTLKSIHDGVIKTQIDGSIELMNREGLRLLGLDEAFVLGSPFGEVVKLFDVKSMDPIVEPLSKLQEKLIKTTGVRRKYLLETKARGLVFIDLSGSPIFDSNEKQTGFVYVIRDIHRQQKIEEELLSSQKLESIGMLAGGIAHDFNNSLLGILGNAQLAQIAESEGRSVQTYVKGIEKAATSAKTLTQQLLTFSKGGEPVKNVFDLIKVLPGIVDFCLRGTGTVSKYKLESGLWPIFADKGQITQVINNLVINACQAMPKGGVITIEAKNEAMVEDSLGYLKSGTYVRLTISDTGEGISQESLKNIFDPFFTTKDDGSGLGLATSYTIVEKHGGMITVKSEPGKGTDFQILLPATPKKFEKEEVESHRTTSVFGKILFMDDEPSILDFVGEVLPMLGHEVVLTDDGEKSIVAFNQAIKEGQPFDLVILDWIIVGGVGGKETIKALLEADPGIKVLASSGYSSEGVLARYEEFGFCGVLPKPYRLEDLRDIIALHLETDSTITN